MNEGNFDGSRTETTTYIRGFDALGKNDLALAGGKGTNLGELVRAGFLVPSGFVLTAEAYRELIDDPEIRAAIDDLEALDSGDAEELTTAAETLRSLVREREFDEGVAESITEALELAADTTYAVRSSATAEDLPAASFAGQHDTYLGIEADAVLDRVRECMASLFTDRAVAYRARNGIPNTDVAMAVVVQEMVDADAAGVLFTADPDTNDRTIASIDATYGLGDTVVSGEISADNARVKKSSGEILDYEIGSKDVELALAEEGTESLTASADRRERRALSDGQLTTLVEVGNRVERLFDEPQDVE
jgi:pyruvate,water dikinase